MSALWTLVPALIALCGLSGGAGLAFAVIGVGAAGCIVGGWASRLVGSALSMQNAIGFAITMGSIQVGTALVSSWGEWIAWLLLPGPLLGLWGLAPLWLKSAASTSPAAHRPR